MSGIDGDCGPLGDDFFDEDEGSLLEVGWYSNGSAEEEGGDE